VVHVEGVVCLVKPNCNLLITGKEEEGNLLVAANDEHFAAAKAA
jgi:hypothetical protein